MAAASNDKQKIIKFDKILFGIPWRASHTILPGLITTALLAWVSMKASGFIGIKLMGFEKSPVSSVMIAVILGILIRNIFTLPKLLKPGIKFSVKKLLKLGIIFLGIRLSIPDILKVGLRGLPIIIACILAALILSSVFGNRLKLPMKLAALIGVGTSICGVSAIVATAPAIDASDEEVAYAVTVITVFGLFATVVYPYFAHTIFNGDVMKIGLFLGTAIHDTSQVTGAGLVYSEVFASPRVLEIATVTKLVRNIFMVGVIPYLAFSYTKRAKASAAHPEKTYSIKSILPWFIIGFLIMAALRSFGEVTLTSTGRALYFMSTENWLNFYGFIKQWAVNLFVLALAGVGLSTDFRAIKKLGIKPFIVGLGTALIVGLVSFTAITILIK
jgi:uncharacterized integral membrane protein (TIGR00698 family)